jgi:O-acetyl-ADP-ribose deacetylase
MSSQFVKQPPESMVSRRKPSYDFRNQSLWTPRMAAILRATYGDIVSLNVDVVVNAANSTLLGGGGVDGAIHDAAGPELFEACQRLGGCEIGDAKITIGYRMKAAYIVHAVGPIWRGGGRGEPQLLASCYRRSLELAAEYNAASIAFPSISTGAFGYPIELAAPVAIAEVQDFARAASSLREVTFCCFSPEDLATYEGLLRKKWHDAPRT